MKLFFSNIFIILLISCSGNKTDFYLFENIRSNESPSKLSEAISNNFQIISLETNDESILGQIYKIKKYNSNYYILSNGNWITQFDNDGKYVSTMRKPGSGPGEYTLIGDFDIYDNEGKAELWLSDYNCIKIYDAETLEFLRKIEFNFVLTKFQKLTDGTLLILCPQSEKTLALTTTEGHIVEEFLDKEIAYIITKSVQFKKYNNLYLFELACSNEFIYYNTDDKTFGHGAISKGNQFISASELKKLFEKFQMEYLREVINYDHFRGIWFFKDKWFFNILINEKRYFVSITDKEIYNIEINNSKIINDISDNLDISFLQSLGVADSENSLLFVGTCNSDIDTTFDQNPCLIEFFL